MVNTPSNLEDNYFKLPENSQGDKADNPEILDKWLNDQTLNKEAWPYIMLCRDSTQGTYTWHMLCDEYDIFELIESGLKRQIDRRVSKDRHRSLSGIELFCRYDSTHQFLNDENAL